MKCSASPSIAKSSIVTPRAGVWIEIEGAIKYYHSYVVTPRAGVWIEIAQLTVIYDSLYYVTPRAGVWIEIVKSSHAATALTVTPRAGVWIEIILVRLKQLVPLSLPVRECGLKYLLFVCFHSSQFVTPRAGVWIEIVKVHLSRHLRRRHSPCGSVD